MFDPKHRDTSILTNASNYDKTRRNVPGDLNLQLLILFGVGFSYTLSTFLDTRNLTLHYS